MLLIIIVIPKRDHNEEKEFSVLLSGLWLVIMPETGLKHSAR